MAFLPYHYLQWTVENVKNITGLVKTLPSSTGTVSLIVFSSGELNVVASVLYFFASKNCFSLRQFSYFLIGIGFQNDVAKKQKYITIS